MVSNKGRGEHKNMVSAESIRAVSESNTTFDLAGQDAASIQSIIREAFSEPFHLADARRMIRITFVVGLGKASKASRARARYDRKGLQAVTSTLKELNYVEEKGASSLLLECAGRFKTQHDTDKNLFTVVVFPGIVVVDKGGDEAMDNRDDTTNEHKKLLASSSLPSFESLLSIHCPSYLEKRACLGCLEQLHKAEKYAEDKMAEGHLLTSKEREFYDSSCQIEEKMALTQKEARRHVEEGRLTVKEKEMLVDMNQKRIETLMNDEKSPTVEMKLEKSLARKKQLQSLADDSLAESTSYPPPLRYESQIADLRKKLLPLQALEGVPKGRLMTIDETRLLAEKEEIGREIERLENASRGWFEEEQAFWERVQRSRNRFESEFSDSKGDGGKKKSAKKGWKRTSAWPEQCTVESKSGIEGSSTPVAINKMLRGVRSQKMSKGGSSKDAAVIEELSHPAISNVLIPPVNESSDSSDRPLVASVNAAEPSPPGIDVPSSDDDDAPLPISQVDSAMYDEELAEKYDSRAMESLNHDALNVPAPPIPDSYALSQYEDDPSEGSGC